MRTFMLCFFVTLAAAAQPSSCGDAYRPLVAVADSCSTNEFAAVATSVLDEVAASGANPVLLPETANEDALKSFLAHVDMVLVPSVGPFSPRRQDWEARLGRLATAMHIPRYSPERVAKSGSRAKSGGAAGKASCHRPVAVPDYCLTNGLSAIKSNMVTALVEAGFYPYVIPFTADNKALAASIEPADALLVAGGSKLQGYAKRCELEVRAIRIALERAIPIAGVCHGCQVINIAFGGTLKNTPQASGAENPQIIHKRSNVVPWTDTYHAAETVAGSRIAAVLGIGTVIINSSHSRCIDKLAHGIKVTARAPDGVVEAIEHETLPVMAFQFHPERMSFDKRMVKLIRMALSPRD